MEDPASGIAQQLTWTVLPQGFRYSPHFFGQALAQDLSSLDLQPSTLFLLCSPTLTYSQDYTSLLLNFLAQKGYWVSPSKAQFPYHRLNTWGSSNTDLQTDYSRPEGPHQVIDGPLY
jgi:hypothetical protein